jgi:hypothetical protein
MPNKHKYNIGDIVTLKSHPLFKDHKKIIEFSAQVPPLMLIKEIFYEDAKKKKIFSEELGADFQVADLIKYTCTYFNANKSEFVDVFIYESFLNSYSELKYYREIKEEEEKKIEEDKQLIAEVLTYKQISKYEYGKVVQFKTKKLEQRKSYDGNHSEKITNSSFQTPDFVLSGIKNENVNDLFYFDGKPKRIISNQLFKIIWFNHFQNKYSEIYLPKEFLVENIL